MNSVPTSDIGLYSDEALNDPWPRFRALRDLASTVWLEQYEIYVHPRFAECRAALRAWETYSSAQGVMMNDAMNQTLRGILLCSDGSYTTVVGNVSLMGGATGSIASWADIDALDFVEVVIV